MYVVSTVPPRGFSTRLLRIWSRICAERASFDDDVLRRGANLSVPGFDLGGERLVVALRLIQLLRRRRLLREQTSRAVIGSLRDVALRLEHAELAHRLVDVGAARRALRRRLAQLEDQRARIHHRDDVPGAERLALQRHERLELAGGLRADDDLCRFHVAVCVGTRRLVTSGRAHARRGHGEYGRDPSGHAFHCGISKPSVVR